MDHYQNKDSDTTPKAAQLEKMGNQLESLEERIEETAKAIDKQVSRQETVVSDS